MVTSRHLSTFSLQTPPSTKMPLLLWLCFAQTPMPSIATVNNVLFEAAFKIRSIPTSSTTAVSLYRSVALARIPHSTTQAKQKTNNGKSITTFSQNTHYL